VFQQGIEREKTCGSYNRYLNDMLDIALFIITCSLYTRFTYNSIGKYHRITAAMHFYSAKRVTYRTEMFIIVRGISGSSWACLKRSVGNLS